MHPQSLKPSLNFWTRGSFVTSPTMYSRLGMSLIQLRGITSRGTCGEFDLRLVESSAGTSETTRGAEGLIRTYPTMETSTSARVIKKNSGPLRRDETFSGSSKEVSISFTKYGFGSKAIEDFVFAWVRHGGG